MFLSKVSILRIVSWSVNWLFRIIKRSRHAEHCWRIGDELISDVLLWTPSHSQVRAGRPARTYIQQLCEDTRCSPEGLPEAMNNREKWRERVRDIRAGCTTWWWWWWRLLLCYYSFTTPSWPLVSWLPHVSTGLSLFLSTPTLLSDPRKEKMDVVQSMKFRIRVGEKKSCQAKFRKMTKKKRRSGTKSVAIAFAILTLPNCSENSASQLLSPPVRGVWWKII